MAAQCTHFAFFTKEFILLVHHMPASWAVSQEVVLSGVCLFVYRSVC